MVDQILHTAPWAHLAAFLAAMVVVMLRGLQNLFLVHRQLLPLMPNSMLIAWTDAVTVYLVAINGFDKPLVICALGLGGGTGCLLASFIHRRMTRRLFSDARPT